MHSKTDRLNAMHLSSTPDLPLPPPPPPEQTSQKRAFNKKLLIPIATVVVIVIVAVALLIPQGQATIPLEVNYRVGERMVYSTTVSASMPSAPFGLGDVLNGSLSVTGEQTIDVVDFDGEFYTLNHTISMQLADYPTTTFSLTEKMNKTGYSTYIFDIGSAALSVSSQGGGYGGYLAQLLSKPEVKVGDSINVPFPPALQKLGIEGSIMLTFNGVQDLTVPAGTYKVFRVDMTSNGLRFNTSALAGNSSVEVPSVSMSANMQCQTYMEYGTMRQIKTTMQEDISLGSSLMSFTINASMDTTLQEDL